MAPLAVKGQSDWHRTTEQTWKKGGKSTDHDQIRISSEGGQDTSVWQISADSSHAFSRKCLETGNLTCFTKSKCHQSEENQQTVIQNVISWIQFQWWSGYISMLNLRPLLPCVPKKIPETPNLNCFTKSKCCQNEENQDTMTKIWSVLIVVRMNQYVKFQTIKMTAIKTQVRNQLYLWCHHKH